MIVTRKSWTAVFMAFVFVLISIVVPYDTVKAQDITPDGASAYTVKVGGTYCQTMARSMLDLVNDFRTGSDAWYWNQDNTTKTVCSSLGTLSYDYGLEEIAMQRAMEIAIHFDHGRPNGSSCWSLYNFSYGAISENIAAHYNKSASAAFTLWQETDKDYFG